MKYRVISIKIQRKSKKTRRFKRRRQGLPIAYTALRERSFVTEKISLDTLFEIGELEEPKKPRKLKRLLLKVKRAFAVLMSLIKKLNAHSSRKERNSPRLGLYTGGLCAAVCALVISAVLSVLSLFAPFMSPYEKLRVPSVTGISLNDALNVIDPRFEIAVSYVSSDDTPAGVIISQFPKADTERKLYKDKICALSLSVSAGKSFYTVEELCGKQQRDALLLLRNRGVAVTTVYQYSDSVASGTVISTSPPAGERLFSDSELTLTVSVGKRISSVSVPNLYLLSEARAASALAEKGLKLGAVSYATSDAPMGKIIEQSVTAHSRLPRGSSIDVTVSLGNAYAQKTVPDLFGLTVEEAERELSRAGLVLGGIYTVSSGAPSGSVVSQTPMAGTPINSQITSVDVYISMTP